MAEANDLHPSGELLSGFALGKLDDGQIAVVASHLSDCATCRDTAAAATDPFLDLLRPDPSDSRDAFPLPAALLDHCRYRIIRGLGRGGMGSVYLAEHRMMKQLRAIKVINPALISNPRAVERFVREIQLLPNLCHPAIVRGFDGEEAGGLYLLVMEYVEGESLAQVVERQGALPVGVACEYARQAAVGLQYAHEQGLVHRDIKPANLMLTGAGQIKILDFGLARLASESRAESGLTHEHAAMGTPDYSAPEQALDARNADARADIYSLGCTLFFLLTAKPPFGKPSALAVSAAHLHEPPPLLSELRPDAPDGLCDLVRRMLAKLPDQRPQTPAEVAASLTQFIAPEAPRAEEQAIGQPADRRPSPEAAPRKGTIPARPGRRLRWAACAAAAISAAALLVWGAAVLRVRTSQGTIVLEQLPADAEVLVDGDTVALKFGDGGAVEISVAAGKKHQLQVKKDGFKVFGKELEIDAGVRQPVTVRLEREPAAVKPARVENDGFVALFDGTDLKGWTTFDGGTGGWKVEGGAIVGKGHVSVLYNARRDFEDFHLRVEAMVSDGGDSAVYFRAPFVTGRGPPSYRAQIDATGDDAQKTGSLYTLGPCLKKLHEPDEWFTLEAIVQGEHIVLKVNGVVTADVTDPRFTKGHFALAESDSPTVVKFRKIEVKKLPPPADDP